MKFAESDKAMAAFCQLIYKNLDGDFKFMETQPDAVTQAEFLHIYGSVAKAALSAKRQYVCQRLFDANASKYNNNGVQYVTQCYFATNHYLPVLRQQFIGGHRK